MPDSAKASNYKREVTKGTGERLGRCPRPCQEPEVPELPTPWITL